MRRLHRETAADLPGAAKDRLADHGRGDHLIVEDDGERLIHVILGEIAELARTGVIEAKRNHRFVGAAVEGRLRIDQLIAAHDRGFAQKLGPSSRAPPS